MRRITFALVAALVALAVSELPAQAGTYDVWTCAGPAGEPLPATGWVPESMGGTIDSSCGTRGGSFSGSLNSEQVASGSFARWTFQAPKDTTIGNVTVQRVAASSAVYMYWHRSYFLFRDSPVVWDGYGLDVCASVTGPCQRPGDPANPFSELSRFTAPAVQAGRLIASAQCDGPNPCPAQGYDSIGRFAIYRARIGLADAFPPEFREPPTGGLLEAAKPLAGIHTVNFDGSDRGGGIQAAEIVVDGVPKARSAVSAGGTCREPFNQPVPCPLNAEGTIALDTTLLENGQHRVQVALVDAAANRMLSDPVVLNVHNDKEPNGVGASRMARLTAAFHPSRGTRRIERTVEYGKAAPIRGRLVDGAGAPIARAELLVHTRLDRLGEQERIEATIRTRRNGRFRWSPAPGPSRLIRIGYRTYKTDAVDAASAEVKLGVRPAIALTVNPTRVRNRGRIMFRGRLVRGPGKGGAQVTIEAVGRNVRQRVPVATLRTDKRGRFRFSYRFLRSFAPFTYRFHARLIRQASYPYASGSSRIVTVKIVR